MHNTRTEYKGFTIETESHDGLGTVRFRHYVIDRNKVKNNQTADGFNISGYPTLNHAKGAITNYLKTQQSVYPQDEASYQAEAAERYNEAQEPTVTHSIVLEPQYKQEPITATLATEHVLMSRNKREGYFVGCTDGGVVRLKGARSFYNMASHRYTPANRKQRKLAKMHGYRDSAAQ